MEANGHIERAILNCLTGDIVGITPPEYLGNGNEPSKKRTDDLVTLVWRVRTGKFGDIYEPDYQEGLVTSVRRALGSLEGKGLIQRVDPPDPKDNPKYDDDRVAWWAATLDGESESRELFREYNEKMDELRRRYGMYDRKKQ